METKIKENNPMYVETQTKQFLFLFNEPVDQKEHNEIYPENIEKMPVYVQQIKLSFLVLIGEINKHTNGGLHFLACHPNEIC